MGAAKDYIRYWREHQERLKREGAVNLRYGKKRNFEGN